MLIITIDYLLSITFYNVTVFLIQIIACTLSLVGCFYTFLRNSLQFFYYFFLLQFINSIIFYVHTHTYTHSLPNCCCLIFLSAFMKEYIYFFHIYLLVLCTHLKICDNVCVCVGGTCSSYDITLHHKTRKTVYDDGATIKLITSAAKKFYLMD